MWHLHRRKGRRVWEIVSGRKRVTTGTTRRILAEKLLSDYFLRSKGLQVNSHEPISKHIEEYLRDRVRFNKASTVQDKQRTFRFFVERVGNVSLGGCGRSVVSGYLVSREISAERWNCERQFLSNFFKWCQKEGYIDHNPAEGVPRKKVIRSKIPKALSREDENRLLQWCRSRDQELGRMAVVVGNTGIRVRELANLQRADVVGDAVRITAKPDWQPKDYEERAIPKTPIIEKVIKEQIHGNLSNWVFPKSNGERYGKGLESRMQNAFKKSGVGSGGFHRLRHTFATRAIENGMDLETLRVLMGHSDMKTLQKYLHVSGEHIRKQAGLVRFGG